MKEKENNKFNSEEKIEWLEKQKKYWCDKSHEEPDNTHAQNKYVYYSNKYQYWALRKQICVDIEKPTKDEMEILAQKMKPYQ